MGVGCLMMSQDSVTSTVTRQHLDTMMPNGINTFFSSQTVPDWLWVSNSLLFNEYPVGRSGVKKLQHKVDHPLPSSVEYKTE